MSFYLGYTGYLINLPLLHARICTFTQQMITNTIKNNPVLVKQIIANFSAVFNPSQGMIKNCKVMFNLSQDAVTIVLKPRLLIFHFAQSKARFKKK